jgi:acetyl-CoA carboxylase biotin carboxyl carrier protein
VSDTPQSSADTAPLHAVLAEARDLIRQLEGSTVQRLALTAGGCSIEVERAAAGAPLPATDGSGVPQISGALAPGAGPGPGVAPEARSASGAFRAITEADSRVPVLAPLVGTFYAAPQPGAKPFVEVGDIVEIGQTLCIVEAMKMMNEVAAGEPGRVAEIAVQAGEPVEFEQVLMYLEPVGE